MPAVKGTRVEISRREITTRPLTDGKPERQEKQGLSITGVWGEAPQSQSAFEIKKRANIIKNLDKPLYTGLFEVFV